MGKRFESPDKDIRWVMNQNLNESRIYRADPNWVDRWKGFFQSGFCPDISQSLTVRRALCPHLFVALAFGPLTWRNHARGSETARAAIFEKTAPPETDCHNPSLSNILISNRFQSL